MFSACFVAFVGVSCLVALQNWRWGLLLCVVIGLLQDPVRKVTPGCPAYLLLLTIPVYASAFFALVSQQPCVQRFFRRYPQTRILTLLLFTTLVVSSVQTLSYGLQTAPW